MAGVGDIKITTLVFSARIVGRNPRHARIQVFQNGADAGTLTIDAEVAHLAVRFLNDGLDEIETLKDTAEVVAEQDHG